MLYLRNALQLVIDRFNQDPFSEKNLVSYTVSIQQTPYFPL